MRKNVIKGVLCVVFLVLFNVMFFVIGGVNHPTSVWISYAWIHVAYFMMIAAPLFARKTQSATIFQLTSAQISSVYFFVEFIIGLIFIFIRLDSVKFPIIIQLIPFCLFLVVFCWNMLHNEHTADNEQKRNIEISFIKTASSKAKFLMDNTTDPILKNKIEKVYDLLHSSPSKSYASVKELENNVMMLLGELGMTLEENNLDEANKIINRIQYTMEERNRIVALSN